MNLYRDLKRRCRNLTAEALRLARLVAGADQLDAAGDGPLSGPEVARLLLKLDRLVYHLGDVADGLAGRLPIPGPGPAQGACSCPGAAGDRAPEL